MKKMKSSSFIFVVSLLCFAFSNEALAHAKWFVDYDIVKPPLAIGEVLSKKFIYLFLFSAFSIYIFFLIDRYLYKNNYFVILDEKLKTLNMLSILIMRICAGVFFISLWAYQQINGVSFILTPELKITQALIPSIYLLLAACTLSAYTTPIIGIGIIALYVDAIVSYGIYHLLDYIIFLGIAYFFMVTVTTNKNWLKSGFIVLFASTGITFLWASMEKFAYPYWVYPLLEKNPGLLMGLSQAEFMLIAGFVEFNVTFILFSAASLLTRLIALVLDSIFILAIFKFGIIDAIGHLMFIAILVVLIVRGPTDARNILILNDKSIWMEAYFMTGLYFLAFVMFFIMYYGFHHLCYSSLY